MKKVNWKRILMIAGAVLYAVVFLVSVKLIFTYAYNEFTNKQLEADNTDGSYEVLQYLNYPQPYIAYYNQGNLEYQRGRYEEAIAEYEKALQENIPAGEECKVRINEALSYIATLPGDYDAIENIPDSLETLYTARDILLEQECAKDEGRGHNSKAQRLKEEIDDEIERLEELLEQQQQEQGEGEEEEENGSGNQNNEDDNQSGGRNEGEEEQNGGSAEEDEAQQWENQIQEQLQQQAEESYQERQMELQRDEDLYSDSYDYDFSIRRW
ncbi:MAG: tetratricopeptide repeat protein [Lachnospiraceae bacterium]